MDVNGYPGMAHFYRWLISRVAQIYLPVLNVLFRIWMTTLQLASPMKQSCLPKPSLSRFQHLPYLGNEGQTKHKKPDFLFLHDK
jgi:hypothetical protein